MDVRETVAVVSATTGNFDDQQFHAVQDASADFHYDLEQLTDKDFEPRFNSMTPRLQARLAKMFSWQLVPGYDIYLWVDSSCKLVRPDAVEWFLEKLGNADMAAFKHPHRKTVQEEADYLKYRLSINCPYVTPRYENEWIDAQLEEVEPNAPLFATTALIYRDNYQVQQAMKEWWYHNSRYHTDDQLSFTWAMKNLKLNVIPNNYLKIPYMEYTRNKK